ncbi:OpgC domain-containing protein [Paraburkholderia saeva]|nr:OpgC domain-containing protein [Paraburkholderia saeva]
MQQSQHRFIELDFFRGLVLVIIVVDHIGGSILSRFTLHAWALCDAAEVFVFLGGFATATAYAALAERRTDAIARNRFLKRSLEIYRAFLVTAGLMLLVSAVMLAFSVDAPNLPTNDLDELIDAPLASLGDILLLRRQPYLASVLPMYTFFALMVPVALPLARSKPWLLLAGSVALWAAAPHLAGWLPGAEDTPWDFNPLAWQLMFVLGVIARCQPVYPRITAHRMGWLVTLLAAGVVAAAAYYRLAIETAPLDASFKQNLMWLRAVNFLAIAWLVANVVRVGWAGKIAQKLPWISLIGRKGLVCFVAGTVISLVVDSLLYQATDGLLDVPLGLLADAIAVGSLLVVAHAAEPVSRFFASCVSRQRNRTRSVAGIGHTTRMARPAPATSAPSRSTAPSARSSTPGL